MTLALFDFDGTITTKDSLIDFIQFTIGKSKYYKGLLVLSPILILYKLKFIKNNIAKEKFITYFFRDWDIKLFNKFAEQYSLNQIDKIVRKKAIEKIKWHQSKGHQVVVVSASIECWLKPWCEKHNISLISTKLEIKDNRLTGKFATKNCFGIEKSNRVQKVYSLENIDFIYAYGDSSGDKELLALADESYYKPFRKLS